ncbi:MAG: hypothetical protein KBT50_03345 [Cycloclasticus sp.]|nr:hypothetical protein [Cycloclasticus sp.]MBQ0789629.1 hypothetical protein [Cycloclasticus sp.]
MFEIHQDNAIYIAIFYIALGLIAYLSLRKSTLNTLVDGSAKRQIKQSMFMMLGLLVFTVFVLVSGGFLAHQDTAWHQMAQSSENIIPASIVIYVIFYPAFFVIGVSLWLYSRSRLVKEVFDRRFQWALIANGIAPFMFLPSQDPSLVNLSMEFSNIAFRLAYWLVMFTWLSSLSYLLFRLGLNVVNLIRSMVK